MDSIKDFVWLSGIVNDESVHPITGSCALYRSDQRLEARNCATKRGFLCQNSGGLTCYPKKVTWNNARVECSARNAKLLPKPYPDAMGNCLTGHKEGFWIGLRVSGLQTSDSSDVPDSSSASARTSSKASFNQLYLSTWITISCISVALVIALIYAYCKHQQGKRTRHTHNGQNGGPSLTDDSHVYDIADYVVPTTSPKSSRMNWDGAITGALGEVCSSDYKEPISCQGPTSLKAEVDASDGTEEEPNSLAPASSTASLQPAVNRFGVTKRKKDPLRITLAAPKRVESISSQSSDITVIDRPVSVRESFYYASCESDGDE